jgi:hypothetical protein
VEGQEGHLDTTAYLRFHFNTNLIRFYFKIWRMKKLQDFNSGKIYLIY